MSAEKRRTKKSAASLCLSRELPGGGVGILLGCAFSVCLLASSCASVHPYQSHRHGLLDSPDSRRSGSLAAREALKDVSLSWPLRDVQVTSGFGLRGSEFHEGIDLRASVGTPVYAAAPGVVIYAGQQIRGYGNLVVIRHNSRGLATIYAHNSKLLVRVGQKIQRGQRIALSGKTGRVHGPHLHFETRSGIQAFDPRPYLPRISGARRLALNP